MKKISCLTLWIVLFSGQIASSQSALTDEQRKEYARQFQAATLPPGAASIDERRMLLDAQERRMTLPADQKHFKAFLNDRPNFKLLKAGQTPVLGYLLNWNEVALQATALDHYNSNPANPPKSFGEQFGPVRSIRALAIVHVAMFEAVNTITRKYESYQGLQDTIIQKVGVPKDQITITTASINRAIVEAGYETLRALYPNKSSLFETARDLDIPQLGGPTSELGAAIGREAAAATLALRHFDYSELPDLTADDFENPNPSLRNPASWHKDPISNLRPALGGNWHYVKPFVLDADKLTKMDGFLPPAPPAFGTPEFIKAFKDVKRLGGDPNAPASEPRWPTQTDRTGAADPNNPNPADGTNQTFVGIFWGYDGTALLCAPPRLYNMIATSVALREKPLNTVEEMSCYLAFVNASMADAGLAAWVGKYFYLYPRPITVLRSVDADSTAESAHDARWTPLGAPVTNGTREYRNLTPPFPAYPSGHVTFGGALFRAMSLFLQTGPDGVPFDFVSDEYNGFNKGPGEETARARVEAHFTTFTEAEKANAQSRIYLGIHWQFDADKGIVQGNKVAEKTFFQSL